MKKITSLALCLALSPVAVPTATAGLGVDTKAARSMPSFRRIDPSRRTLYNQRNLERHIQRKGISQRPGETTHDRRQRLLRQAKMRAIEQQSIERGLDTRTYKTKSRLERRNRAAQKQRSVLPRTGGILKDIRRGSSTSTQRKAKHISDLGSRFIHEMIDTCKGTSSRRRSACETIQRRKAERLYKR